MGYAAIGHFCRVGITVAGDEIFIPKFGISEVQMGWVYSAFLIAYTIGMLPGGWLIDRIGSARALALFGLTMGTFVVLTGALGWVTSTSGILLVGLLVIRGLAGACNAPLHPGAAHAVFHVMPDHRRTTANGMITAGALVGVAFCYPIFGWLIDSLTWPWAFVVSGLALMSYAAVWRLLAWPSLPRPQLTTTSADETTSAAVRGLLRQRNLWLLTLSYAAFGYFQYLFFYWMGYYFKDVLHVPKVDARWAQFWIGLAQGAGMVIGGLSTDAVCKRLGTMLGRRAVVMTGMGLAAVFGIIAVNVTGFTNVAWCLAISMAAAGMCDGVFWTTAIDIGGKSRGLTGAFMNTGGNIGGFLSPILTPIMALQIGWPASITVACIFSLVGGLVWLWIKPPASD
jgi:MFS family permease